MFSIVYNKSLKIYSQLYVGIREPKNEDEIPLAFATPYEDNAAGKKRQTTVDAWAAPENRVLTEDRGWIYTRGEPKTKIIDNTPRAGFRITDSVKRTYFGGGNVVWRVFDPDGWEVEIQSNNLMAVIQTVDIGKGGEISGRCVWSRDGAHNILLPEVSQEYQDAIKAAESVKKPTKLAMKDRVIGRTYRLLNGGFGQYLGKVWVTSQTQTDAINSCSIVHDHKLGKAFGISTRHYGARSGQKYTKRLNFGAQTQYEAVYIPSVVNGGYTSATQIILYKSAPLISELDEVQMQADALIETVLKTNPKFEFASSAAIDTPVFCTAKKPTSVKYTLEPVSAAMLQEQIKYDEYRWEKLIASGQGLDIAHYTREYLGWFFVGQDGKTYGSSSELSFLVGDGTKRIYKSAVYEMTIHESEPHIASIRTQQGASFYEPEPPVSHDTPNGMYLTRFYTIEEFRAYINSLVHDGRLVYLKPEAV